MKAVFAVLTSMLPFAGAFAHADEATEQEVIKTIMDGNAYAKKNLKDQADTVSKDGSWFPRYIVEQFSQMLEDYGQSPIIVRSISLLEDAFGNASSGKYMSVFCPNQGTPEERLANFVSAVKAIYASTINENALTYRRSRGLLDKDEQMALLVMRVSGDVHGKFFFPQLAGVGYSFNPYAWSKDIDPKAGFLRIVFGLGTRAVERKDDYTRLVALNNPSDRMLKSESSKESLRVFQVF